jgi:Zn-dependent protease with chaperone function
VNTVVFVPFGASVLLVALSRSLIARVRPSAAAWALSTAMPLVAVCTVGGLLVLACPLPARVPLVAALGRWAPSAVASHSPVAPVVSALALAALTWSGCRLCREVRAIVAEARTVLGPSTVRRAATEVIVVDDPVPQAHALGVGVLGLGRIVVSSGLLRLLDADERAAVIAHEHAHLDQHHALLATASRLSAALNPLLAPIRDDLRYVLERSADEAAAATTSRGALASGIAKAALATVHTARVAGGAFALHRQAVADRVAALLAEPTERTRAAWVLVAVAVVAAAAVAWALHDTERFFEAARLWSRR